MYVGVLRAVLQIPGAFTLKDRRQVVRSAKDRLKARLSVSVAEVGDVERIQVATLGVAVVARESSVCEETLAGCRAQLSHLSEAILADTRSEIFPFGAGGQNLERGLSEAFDAGEFDTDAPETGSMNPVPESSAPRRGGRRQR